MRNVLKIVLVLIIGWFSGYSHSEYVHRVRIKPLSDQELLDRYKQNNADYFAGVLPENIDVHWAYVPDEENGIADEAYYPHRNKFEIRLDPRYITTPRMADATLLHEECHAFNDVMGEKDPDGDAHGVFFQACMRNLYEQNAFESVW